MEIVSTLIQSIRYSFEAYQCPLQITFRIAFFCLHSFACSFFPLQIDFRVISFYLQPYASYFFLLQTNFLNGDIHRDDIHGVDQLLLRDVEEGSSDAAEEIEPENISLFI